MRALTSGCCRGHRVLSLQLAQLVNNGEAGKGKGRRRRWLGALPPLCSCVAGSLRQAKRRGLIALADSRVATGMAKLPVHIGIVILEATCDMAHGLGPVGGGFFWSKGSAQRVKLCSS